MKAFIGDRIKLAGSFQERDFVAVNLDHLGTPSGTSSQCAALIKSAIASSRIFGVDLHVVEAQVTGHDARAGLALLEIQNHAKFWLLHFFARRR
jgi:hypothetical protein